MGNRTIDSHTILPWYCYIGGVFGQFGPCPLPTLAGRHEDAGLISLTRLAVNNPNPAMQSERAAVTSATCCVAAQVPLPTAMP